MGPGMDALVNALGETLNEQPQNLCNRKLGR